MFSKNSTIYCSGKAQGRNLQIDDISIRTGSGADPFGSRIVEVPEKNIHA